MVVQPTAKNITLLWSLLLFQADCPTFDKIIKVMYAVDAVVLSSHFNPYTASPQHFTFINRHGNCPPKEHQINQQIKRKLLWRKLNNKLVSRT